MPDACPICGKRKGYPALDGRCPECDADRNRGVSAKRSSSRRITFAFLAGLRRRFVHFVDFRSRIAALVIGSGLIFWGYEEYRLGAGADGQAEDVELARLEAGYRPQNQRLRIGRHLRVYEAIMYATRGQNRGNTEVKYALYPLFQADSQPQEVDTFKVLVNTRRFNRVSQLPAANEISPSIDGLLINRTSGLSPKEKELIRASFPRINPDDLFILQEGRELWRSSTALFLMGAGIVAIGASLAAAILSASKPEGGGNAEQSIARKLWDTNDRREPQHTTTVGSAVYDSLIGHRVEMIGVIVASGTCMIAGVTATWTILALFSRSLLLIGLALILATPLNLIFYAFVRKGTSEGVAGLDRTSWLLVAWIAYVLGAGGALWAMMGW